MVHDERRQDDRVELLLQPEDRPADVHRPDAAAEQLDLASRKRERHRHSSCRCSDAAIGRPGEGSPPGRVRVQLIGHL